MEDYPSQEVQDCARKFLGGAYHPKSEQEKADLARGLIALVVPEEVFTSWLNSPHPDLGGRTPRQCIDAGRAGALITLIANAIQGIPS